ncbi:MAG: primosomal protein N' [Gammaproteobacteria bacterium]|nr:primosomal protein N' [Gammaproteobacteria bacterium]
MTEPKILKVAVPVPLSGLFDYLPPRGVSDTELRPGCRVQVPFGRKQLVGVLVALETSSALPRSKLRAALQLLETEPVLDADLLALLVWASDYYQHPLGEVIDAALPRLLRQGRSASEMAKYAVATTAGFAADIAGMASRAPRQAELLGRIVGKPDGAALDDLAELDWDWRGALRSLVTKGLCEIQLQSAQGASNEAPPSKHEPGAGNRSELTLTEAQQEAVSTISAGLGAYQAFLLDGVTGSGKTEVYLRVISEVLARGRQALLLVPEIGLTPQLLARFEKRFDVNMAVLHSGLSDTERLAAWRGAASGDARLIIGTRSAVFAPFPDPGIVVIDEEHDGSFKQQDGFRYSARDLGIMRARRLDIPVVLGSATPSLESINNALRNRSKRLRLPERPGSVSHPQVRLLDMRAHASRQGLSTPLIAAISRHLESGGQVLLFLNRRGYAPALFCGACGWVAPCDRCDARMTLHMSSGRLRCHHCGRETGIPAVCGACADELAAVGQGTERMQETLHELFPKVNIARIDRDSTQRKGSMQKMLDDVQSGRTRILIGTQMLTKGHHFPDVTLVAVLNADQGLFGSDFRSNERFAQTLVQVAGRAGRAEKPGEVVIQTSYPEHPLLQRLISEGYGSFAEAALDERRQSRWPPFTHLAMLRAEAPGPEAPRRYLERAARLAKELAASMSSNVVQVLGPAPAPMEKRAGRYRAQLLLQCASRERFQAFLKSWAPELGQLEGARQVRWSLDVDPIELF